MRSLTRRAVVIAVTVCALSSLAASAAEPSAPTRGFAFHRHGIPAAVMVNPEPVAVPPEGSAHPLGDVPVLTTAPYPPGNYLILAKASITGAAQLMFSGKQARLLCSIEAKPDSAHGEAVQLDVASAAVVDGVASVPLMGSFEVLPTEFADGVIFRLSCARRGDPVMISLPAGLSRLVVVPFLPFDPI